MVLKQIVIATTNLGKAKEFEKILGGDIDVIVPDDLPLVVEDGDTLAENAYKKARSAADHLGRLALADDSGLFVHALGGVPGVHSARFAGSGGDDAANRSKLIALLHDFSDRSAYFATVLCVCAPSATIEEAYFFEGRCDGYLLDHERGSEGFGYDALFVPSEGDGRTFGEMSSSEKAVFSHRSRAIAKFKISLSDLPG
ncbi:MAG: RdgB/HAM1 family non-canonical purine NTP pyrophosphatase [Actinomycetota bacterium]|nr:RdgB/HAM1 family non-canonical purine NTP pyrophosphatase [Actinomycetota bacterium]